MARRRAQRMNVLVSCGVFHPRKGGAESLFQDLAGVLSARGHQITVLTRLLDGTTASESIDGFRIVRLDWPVPYDRVPLRSGVVAGSPAALRRTHQLLSGGRIETVCVGLLDMSAMYLLALRPLVGFRLVTYLHGAEVRDLPRASRAFHWLVTRCLAASDAVVAVSTSLAEDAARAYPVVRDKMSVIPNGIDFARVAAAPAAARTRPYVLYVGRLAGEKNVGTILEAYARAAARIPGVDLVIAGDGPERAALTALARSLALGAKVDFLGEIERAEVFSLIKGATCVVLASDAESHPLIALEALAAGKVMIGPRVVGLADMIEHGKNGALYPRGDVGALADLLVRYAGDPAARADLEKTIARTDLGGYDIRVLADRHVRVWQRSAQR
jgi:glycogen(starch) synthase